MNMIQKLKLVLFSCMIGLQILAQTESSLIQIPLLEDDIQMDGLPNEPIWKVALPLELEQLQPIFQSPPSQDSDVRLFFTEKYLYVGANLYDTEPQKIQSPSYKRDESNPDNDFFNILIDSYNDDRNGLMFGTTPSGLRTDIAISNDAIGPEPFNTSWNTEWFVKTSVHEQGWSLEMQIPLTSLRYEVSNNRTVMGIIVARWIPRNNELLMFPLISPDYGDFASAKVSLAQDFLFEGIHKENPVYITPYLLTGITQERNLNESLTAYEPSNKGKLTAGLDAKYSYKSNLTLDLTINTDFAQVEADDQQINLNRFSLFFPEKRQFFQERSSLFDIRMGGRNRIFHSRNIGLHEEQILPIYGGVRLTGNVHDYELGLMNLQVGAKDTINAENFTVFRMKRQILNPSSFFGTMLTNRMDFQGNYNTVAAVDATIRLPGDNYLFTKFAHSFEDSFRSTPFSGQQSRVFLNLEKVTYAGFVYDISLGFAGANYNPAMGFDPRKDFISSWYLFKYGWITNDHPWISRMRLNSINNIYYNFENAENESQRNSFGYEILLKNGYGASLNVNHRFENIFESFEIESDQTIPIGAYRFFNTDFSFNTPLTAPIYFTFRFESGQYFHGENTTVNISPSWNIGSGVQLSAYYQYSRINLPLQEIANLHLSRIKMLLTLNTKFSMSSFVQYNSSLQSVIGNLRFRYNPREGNDIYLVYNDDFNTMRGRDIPMLPISAGRTILLKYTYMFKL